MAKENEYFNIFFLTPLRCHYMWTWIFPSTLLLEGSTDGGRNIHQKAALALTDGMEQKVDEKK